MRIWLDPPKLACFNLSPGEVLAAVRAQNAQVASGTLGDLPNVAEQTSAPPSSSMASSPTSQQFGNIVLRANADGSAVKLTRRGADRTRRAELCHLGAAQR